MLIVEIVLEEKFAILLQEFVEILALEIVMKEESAEMMDAGEVVLLDAVLDILAIALEDVN